MGLSALLHVSMVRGKVFVMLFFYYFFFVLSHKSFVPDVPINKFCKDCQCQEKYVAILFIIIILGCKREREKPLEPVGAAVFV